jgi:hypothetical protein
MLRPIVVVWIAATGMPAGPAASVGDWARRHGLEARPLPALPPAVRHDPSTVARLESLLDEARNAHSAIGSGDEAFREIDRLLDLHPELPQAAWLLGERLARQARFERRRTAAGEAATGSTPDELELSRRAASLTGARAAVLGEVAVDAPLEERAVVAPRVRLRANDVLLLDGEPQSFDAHWRTGRHHLQVLRDGVRLQARWLTIDETSALVIDDPSRACSPEDFLGMRDGPTSPAPPAGTLCPDWLAASAGADGSTRVAVCHGASCGSWQPTEPRLSSALLRAPTQVPEDAGVPGGWVTWAAVGVGAIVGTGALLWKTGAFSSTRTETEFVFTGPTAATAISF